MKARPPPPPRRRRLAAAALGDDGVDFDSDFGPRQSPSLPDSLGSAIVHPIAPGCRLYTVRCPPIPAPAHPQAVARRRPERCARSHARTAPGRPAHDLRTRFGLSADLAVPGPSTVSRMRSQPLPQPPPPSKLFCAGQRTALSSSAARCKRNLQQPIFRKAVKQRADEGLCILRSLKGRQAGRPAGRQGGGAPLAGDEARDTGGHGGRGV